jgi:phosphoglycolate phosphatase
VTTNHYQHIIWDWNGTLFDDAWLCIEIMNALLRQRNLPPMTPELYETIFDFPVKDYYRKAGFDFTVEPFETVSDAFIAQYYRRMHQCPLRDHARSALEMGHKQGLTMSILSAMEQKYLLQLVGLHGLRDYFTDVIGLSDHHAAGKVFLARQWLKNQTLTPSEILFIGDTTHDHEVAQALGVDCQLIHSGHHARTRLAALDVPIIESLLDLFDHGPSQG